MSKLAGFRFDFPTFASPQMHLDRGDQDATTQDSGREIPIDIMSTGG